MDAVPLIGVDDAGDGDAEERASRELLDLDDLDPRHLRRGVLVYEGPVRGVGLLGESAIAARILDDYILVVLDDHERCYFPSLHHLDILRTGCGRRAQLSEPHKR